MKHTRQRMDNSGDGRHREESETTLVVRINNTSQTITTKNGRMVIEIFNHDPADAPREEK